MDKTLLDQLTKKLQTSKDKLVSQLENMTQEKEFDKDKVQVKWKEMGNKEEDSAVEVAEYQDSISLERNLEESLEKIQKALDRIDNGKYGICESCNDQIEEERLNAYPEAALCLKCKSKQRL